MPAKICFGLALSSACTIAVASERIALKLPVSEGKVAPYYALNLPISLYSRSANSQLSDLKIRNAKGDYLNYAWLDQVTETVKLESHRLPIFPIIELIDASANGAPQLNMEVIRAADGSLRANAKIRLTEQPAKQVSAWIIDASKLSQNTRLVQASVKIPDTFEGIANLHLDVSEDFRQWRVLGGREQLVQLRHQGERIQKLSIPLHGVKAQYVRLRWEQVQTAPQILGFEIDSQEQSLTSPDMQWTPPLSASRCDANSCEYTVPENTPVDSMRIQLQEKNTLAKLQIFGELIAKQAPYQGHHYRNPLYVLRHQKHMAVTTPATQEALLGDLTAYRLDMPEGELNNEEFALNSYPYRKIRLQIAAGLRTLGATPPTITIGSLTRSLVFLARGEAPYQIELRHETKDGSALALSTLMPNSSMQNLALPYAEVLLPSSATINNQAQAASITAIANTSEPDKINRKYWLWAALLVVLAALGAMAWSLLRNIDREN
jgi:hypothetical protein